DGDLPALVAAGQLDSLRGIGETLREAIAALVTDGRLPLLDELRAKTPPGLMQMLRIPGLGPKKVKALHEHGVSDLEALQKACENGTVAALKGFGAKTQEKILGGIAFLAQTGQRVRIDQATELAQSILAQLRKVPGVVRLEACGSLRRRRETVGDLDILCTSTDPAAAMKAFTTLPAVAQVLNQGETLSSVMLGVGRRGAQVRGDLRVVTDEQFPYALHHFTGSQAHNVHLRSKWKEKGFKINEYGLTGPNGPVTCTTEADVFAALGLDYIPPELREDTGEIESAANHQLPRLVEVKDIRGIFHNHTTASDGGATLEEMVEAAQALGLQYLGIADHSQSLTVARGLTPDRVRQQHEAIDRLNDSLDGFRVFKGTECDILADGALDFDDRLLETFDYVVASVHSLFNQSREEMTARIVKAVRHPLVTMLGHATGRLLLQRDGYQVDLEAVLRAAAEAGTMVEINAQPKRLDIDWVHCKRAKALGVILVINPDAHSTDELELYTYGVDVARRGWLGPGDIFNSRTTAQVERELGL
ncbi:MAG TPA: DNA polymerase/3'-5' exonuclease PolX, partial [Gemmataceae bacterium]|nr:DNA polymerase/3'-5' exonuclease PolX [Gemmataceae bacterium]